MAGYDSFRETNAKEIDALQRMLEETTATVSKNLQAHVVVCRKMVSNENAEL